MTDTEFTEYARGDAEGREAGRRTAQHVAELMKDSPAKLSFIDGWEAGFKSGVDEVRSAPRPRTGCSGETLGQHIAGEGKPFGRVVEFD
jgi:hypothetical protein